MKEQLQDIKNQIDTLTTKVVESTQRMKDGEKKTIGQLIEEVYDTITLPESLTIFGYKVLQLAPHSKEFVDEQKKLLKQMNFRKVVMNICQTILDEIQIEKGE